MERYSSRQVDELGRIVIPSGLRQELRLETGDRVSFTHVGSIAVMQRFEGDAKDGGAYGTVSELGMITLPAALRQALKLKEKDKVALYHTDDLIIIKSAKKN